MMGSSLNSASSLVLFRETKRFDSRDLSVQANENDVALTNQNYLWIGRCGCFVTSIFEFEILGAVLLLRKRMAKREPRAKATKREKRNGRNCHRYNHSRRRSESIYHHDKSTHHQSTAARRQKATTQHRRVLRCDLFDVCVRLVVWILCHCRRSSHQVEPNARTSASSSTAAAIYA